jgi:hypothetical protein
MSKVDERPHLVWIRGVGGKPEPQKWGYMDFGVGGWKTKLVLASHPISDAEMQHIPIDELAQRFPAPPEHAVVP